MIVLKANKPLSLDMMRRVQGHWACDIATGRVPVVGPEFDVIELHQPVMSGPLVTYLAQLGDA